MKTLWIKAAVLSTVFFSTAFYAQETSLRDYLAPEKSTRNVFEDPKIEAPEYDGVKVSVGGDFALQFQALDHSTEGFYKPSQAGYYVGTSTALAGSKIQLYKMHKDFNLPTANLDVNAYLAKGVKMHLRTYLSARHHNEAWVKGGYIQIDNLDFISSGFLGDFMKNARVKVGMDEINYGDSHFRRSDNAETINNPFVGNNIMDSFTTEAFGEAYYFKNGFFGMLGLANGKLNQLVIETSRYNGDNKPTLYAKAGFDKQLDSNLRVRLTGSVYSNSGTTTGTYLYGSDRAGGRYYYTLANSAVSYVAVAGTSTPVLTLNGGLYSDGANDVLTAAPQTNRFNPGFKKNLAFQINPFIKYQGLEFFGVYEHVSGYKALPITSASTKGSYSQYVGELLYRFGNKEQFYLGGRYNLVTGKDDKASTTAKREITRYNVAGGWFMTKNILAKVEYVSQKYNNSAAWDYTPYDGGKFNGFMFEATIGF